MKLDKLLEALKIKWASHFDHNMCGRYGEPYTTQAIVILENITKNFFELGLADTNFANEILSNDKGKYNQRLSELLMSDILLKNGFSLQSSDEGPDFKGKKNDKTIWFEVITPNASSTMEEIVSNYDPLNPVADNTYTFNNEALLRVTAAFSEKHRKIEKYISKGIINAELDAVVIVINPYLLLMSNDLAMMHEKDINYGNSFSHLAVEALLGRYSEIYQKESSEFERKNTIRDKIQNHNGGDIYLNQFLTDECKSISGVMISTLGEEYAISKVLAQAVVDRGKEQYPFIHFSHDYDQMIKSEDVERITELKGQDCIDFLEFSRTIKNLQKNPLILLNDNAEVQISKEQCSKMLIIS